MKKLSLLFAASVFLALTTPNVHAENIDVEETDEIEDVKILDLDKKASVNSVSIFVTRERMYTSNTSIPSSLYVSQAYNGYLYRGNIYLNRVERLSGGNYMAYYSGNIPKTPIMTSNIKVEK